MRDGALIRELQCFFPSAKLTDEVNYLKLAVNLMDRYESYKMSLSLKGLGFRRLKK